MRRKILILTSAVTLAVIWVVSSTHAFNPQPDPPGKWGMIGINQSETGQLNIVSDAMDACTIGLGFMDSNGNVIKGEFRALRPGQAQFLDLSGSQAVGRGENRAEVRPFLREPSTDLPTGFPPGPCRNFSAKYEVFERGSGQPALLVPAVMPGPSTTPITAAGQ